MNERLRYEEQLAQQWNDLPLPDENKAWEDMKRRLEEDDDDGIIPFWLRGCGLWSLLAIVLLGIGWWIVRPEKWWNKKQETENVTTTQSKEKATNSVGTTDTTQLINQTNKERTRKDETNSSKDLSSTISPIDHSNNPDRQLKKENKDRIMTMNVQIKNNPANTGKQPVKRKTGNDKKVAGKNNKIQSDNERADISLQPAGTDKKDKKQIEVTEAKDSTILTVVAAGKIDSVIKKDTIDHPIAKKDTATVKTNEHKKDSSKSKSISFSAGLAMHQLIPVDGQKLTPYNSQGRKGSLADYIPSVYFRMNKENKWFIQVEFRYGAPQYVKNLLYHQVQHSDTVAQAIYTTTTSYNLKKTFYHQLPVSFNYYIVKNWSLGAGIVWNKFYSAVSDQTIDRKNNGTQADSVISKQIVASKQDTNAVFSKSYFQALFETQYKWRRFSFGAKYSFGLQPYIKFNLPGSPSQDERNKSLQIFLRYELWKSKSKNK